MKRLLALGTVALTLATHNSNQDDAVVYREVAEVGVDQVITKPHAVIAN